LQEMGGNKEMEYVFAIKHTFSRAEVNQSVIRRRSSGSSPELALPPL
jgi:hypothetical protein